MGTNSEIPGAPGSWTSAAARCAWARITSLPPSRTTGGAGMLLASSWSAPAGAATVYVERKKGRSSPRKKNGSEIQPGEAGRRVGWERSHSTSR